jgi:hypothetical protein
LFATKQSIKVDSETPPPEYSATLFDNVQLTSVEYLAPPPHFAALPESVQLVRMLPYAPPPVSAGPFPVSTQLLRRELTAPRSGWSAIMQSVKVLSEAPMAEFAFKVQLCKMQNVAPCAELPMSVQFVSVDWCAPPSHPASPFRVSMQLLSVHEYAPKFEWSEMVQPVNVLSMAPTYWFSVTSHASNVQNQTALGEFPIRVQFFSVPPYAPPP